MKSLKFLLILTVIIVATLSSCEDDSTGSDEVLQKSKYVVSLRTQASDEETADYFLTSDDLMSGEISAVGQGVELIGWNYIFSSSGMHFALGYELNECIGYKDVDGTLVEQGKLAFERMDVVSPIDNEKFLAIGAPWGGGSYDCQLQYVDINNISISKNVKHPIYKSFVFDEEKNENVQLNAWPTFGYVEGDKLFVPFYPLDGVTWETKLTDTASVSIFSYPEIEYIKTIKDTRTSPIGYYASQPCVVEDESGNHYTFSSSSYAAGFTQATKPSGILKINAGTDEFDVDYFFNVEEFGYKVLTAAYAGNDKVVAKVIKVALDTPKSVWAAFRATTPLLNVAVLDLKAKTVTIVDDVPLHGGQYETPMLVEDGMVYLSANDGIEAYVYRVDASTNSATKGAKIIGNELQSISLNM